MKMINRILCLFALSFGPQLQAQYTFGTEVQSAPSASLTYSSANGAFQYEDVANPTTDNAELPLAGSAASIITTSSGWTATIIPSLSAKTVGVGKDAIHLTLSSTNTSTDTVTVTLAQHNNSGTTGAQSVPDNFYGTLAKFIAANNNGNVATTPLGGSSTYNGLSYLSLSGGTAATSTTESLSAATGVIGLSYDSATNTVTGYYNGMPLGSYSLASWGTNPPVSLGVYGESKSFTIVAGDATANNFNVTSGAPTDVGYYGIEKEALYDQFSASAPTLDPVTPYQFGANIDAGTSGALFANAVLTPSVGSTGVVNFTTGINLFSSGSATSLSYRESFATKAEMDATFGGGAGTYNLTLQTTTPNNYSDQFSLGSEDYPAIPQITNMTNASWTASGTLLVADITQPVSITWNNPGGVFVNFYVANSSISSGGQGLATYMIPANSLSNNSYYQGGIQASNSGTGATNSDTIPGPGGFADFQTQVNFTLQTGTPTSSSSVFYSIEKDHVLVQTSAIAPIDGTGFDVYYSPAPYRLIIKRPMAGTVHGPNSTSYPLGVVAGGGNDNSNDYEFSSGAVTSQSNLDGTYLDGSYTMTDGNIVNLTGDGYPAVTQITAVNNNPPVWDAQGHLVLDPTILNTITWSAVTVPNFSTNGRETANFSSNGSTFNGVKVQAGVGTSTSAAFTSLTIQANTMTPGTTFTGKIKYLALSSVGNPSANIYDAAGYGTETDFSAIATYPTGLLQAINFPAPGNQPTGAAPFSLSATASSGLPVSYSLVSGPATLSGTNNSTVTVTGAGTVVIQASQSGGGVYAAAAFVQQSFTVNTSVGFTGNPLATPFNDGVPNLLKYLYDISRTQPMTATDRAALPVLGMDTTTNPGTEYVTLTYRQYALETGITVKVQTSSDLQTWTPVSPPDLSQQVGTDATTHDPIIKVGVRTNGSKAQFIRLEVSLP